MQSSSSAYRDYCRSFANIIDFSTPKISKNDLYISAKPLFSCIGIIIACNKNMCMFVSQSSKNKNTPKYPRKDIIGSKPTSKTLYRRLPEDLFHVSGLLQIIIVILSFLPCDQWFCTNHKCHSLFWDDT